MRKLSLQDYNIYIGDIWSRLEGFVREGDYSRIFVLVDEMTREHCLPVFLDRSGLIPDEVIEIPAGENFKTLETCQSVWDSLFGNNADRKALLINLGGGVIGDLGGFAASTYKRGIRFIQIPTTLLSQIDASIGGKLGIDYYGLKNSVGAFCNPEAVFIFPGFYATLPARQMKSGFAEALKHALIGDAEVWNKIKTIRQFEELEWEDFLARSLSVKQKIVETDPFERGARKALNFGHTIGHAIESISLDSDSPLLHGEAVILGMIAETKIALDKNLLGKNEFDDIVIHLSKMVDFQFEIENRERIGELIRGDKKNEDDRILCTLLSAIGRYEINCEISREEIENSLDFLQKQFDYINA